MVIKNIIFDFDGVILNTPHNKSWMKAMEKLGLEVDMDKISQQTGLGRMDAAENLTDDVGLAKKLAEVKQSIYKEETSYLYPIEEVTSFFNHMQQLYNIAITSRSGNAERMLHSLELEHIPFVEASGKLYASKFAVAANHLKWYPPHTLVVDDQGYQLEDAMHYGFIGRLFSLPLNKQLHITFKQWYE